METIHTSVKPLFIDLNESKTVNNAFVEFEASSDFSLPTFSTDLDFSLIHDTKSELEEVYTLLAEEAVTGSTRLTVKSQNAFVVGMTILVGSGPMQEVRELVGFGSLIVDRALEHHHPVGTLILGRSKSETIHTTVNSDQENVVADTTATTFAFIEPTAEDARDIKPEGEPEVPVIDYAPAMSNEAPDTFSSLNSDTMKSKSRKAVMFVEEGLLESKDVTRESGDVYYRSQSR